jgi:hypothetical protein
MPRHQDPGYYSQHAFTAFIHAEDSPFVRFSLTPHFDPAQCLKKNEAEEVVVSAGGGRRGSGFAARVGLQPPFPRES